MDILEFIEARLDTMLAHPCNWGDAEAFELQVLLLLELRQFAREPATPLESLRAQQDAYAGFLRHRRPDLGPRPLSAATGDIAEIASHLLDFRSSLDHFSASPQPTPAPSAPEDLGTDVLVAPEASTKPRAA